MARVHERQAERLRALHQVIAAVADHKGVRALGNGIVHQLAACAAADCHAVNRLAAVAKAHAACPQAFLDIQRKLTRLHLARQVAHAAKHAVFACLHVPDPSQEQRGCQRIVDAALGAVRIGMHADERNIVFDCQPQDASGRVVLGHAADRGKNRRMVRHDQLSALFCRFGNDRLGHVERTQHICYLLRTVAAQQADVIPAFRKFRRCEALQKSQNILNRRHVSPSNACSISCTSARWAARRVSSLSRACSMPASARCSRVSRWRR